MLAEVRLGPGERGFEHLAVEDVDAHGGEERVGLDVLERAIDGGPVHPQLVEQCRVLRLLHEAGDAPVGGDLHDAEGAGVAARHRDGGDGDVGAGGDVLLEDGAEVHAIELVAGEDEHQLVRVVREMDEVLPHGVGGALVPVDPVGGLLGGEDLDEAAGEDVEVVRVLDVAVERAAVELGQHEDAAELGVDAVADGDVDEAVLAAQGDRRLGAVLGQGEEPSAGAAAHDDGDDIEGAESLGLIHGCQGKMRLIPGVG